MHSIVFTGIGKAHLVHKISPFRFGDHKTFNVRLLYQNTEMILLVSAKTNYTHICIREDR